MSDNISRQAAIDALKAIRYGLWEIDIPSPAGCPKYVEYHEQIQHMMGVVDGWIKKISEEEPTDRTKGKWVEAGNGVFSYADVYARCDKCHEVMFNGWAMDFCPNCGADMRGEGDGR